MNYIEIMKQFAVNIIEAVKNLIRKAEYDQSFRVKITEIESAKKVKILLNGVTHTATAGVQYAVGDIVWVCVPRNNWNNIYVVCKA